MALYPKHGSWLDMAENEISVLRGQVLSRRIPDTETLEAKISAWEEDRNQRKVKIHWIFTIEIARQKLMRLYPSLIEKNLTKIPSDMRDI